MNSGLLKYPSFVTANDDGMKKKTVHWFILWCFGLAFFFALQMSLVVALHFKYTIFSSVFHMKKYKNDIK